MKKMIENLSVLCKKVFGYGIYITLFAGGLTFLGYIAAFIIGGETATEMCTFIYKKIIPIIIYSANILILLGVLSMYLAGEYALTLKKKGK